MCTLHTHMQLYPLGGDTFLRSVLKLIRAVHGSFVSILD